MKLFTVGPVEMYDDTLQAAGTQLPYFRTSEFSQVMNEIQDMFLALVHAPQGSHLTSLTASGTGAMECAIINTLTKEDKALVIDGGSFGHRFAQMCEIHEVPFETLKVPFGDTLTAEMLQPYEGKGYTALLVNIDETSVGQLYDMQMLGEFARRNEMYFIVDAISSFLADPIDMEADHVDLLITASQKALSLSPGMSYLISNERITKERILKSHTENMYFDMKDYLKNMERGQTPFTPAVGIVLELHERLKRITEAGIEKTIAMHQERAQYFRKLCAENGIEVASYPKSNAVTPILVPHAHDVFLKLKNEYDITLTPSGGELADKLLRVGHLGNLQLSDYDHVVKCLKEVLA